MKAAHLRSRVIALVVDRLIFIPALYASGRISLPAFVWVSLTLSYPAYRLYCHAMFGKTIGKHLMGIRVVRADTRFPIGWLESVRRSSVEIALTILVIASSFVAKEDTTEIALMQLPQAWFVACAFAVLFRQDKRGLHDLMAKTIVIEDSISIRPTS